MGMVAYSMPPMPDGMYCIPAAIVTKGMAITSTPPTSAVTSACTPSQRGLPISPAAISNSGRPRAARNAASVQGGKNCTASVIRSGLAPNPAAVRISNNGVGMGFGPAIGAFAAI